MMEVEDEIRSAVRRPGLGLVRPDERGDRKVYGRIEHWFGEHGRAGRIVSGEELKSTRTATTVRFKDGRPIVTDGPFMEAKEVIGGFAVINVPDLDAAIALAKTWPGRSTVEVRLVVEHREGE